MGELGMLFVTRAAGMAQVLSGAGSQFSTGVMASGYPLVIPTEVGADPSWYPDQGRIRVRGAVLKKKKKTGDGSGVGKIPDPGRMATRREGPLAQTKPSPQGREGSLSKILHPGRRVRAQNPGEINPCKAGDKPKIA